MYSSKARFPAFIIGGAAKSGTTSLSRYLAQQPGIFMPERELNFFTHADEKPPYLIENHPFLHQIGTYLEALNPPENLDNNPLIGEKSVSYLYKGYYPQVIKNVQDYHPYWQNLKWIFILRNPAERAYSQYIHNRNFHEELPFEEAITLWKQRKKTGWIPAYDYLGAGFYSEAIKAYQQTFKHVQVYVFEDLKERPEWILNNTLQFLNIQSPAKNIAFRKHNPSGIPKNKLFEMGYHIRNKSSQVRAVTDKLFPTTLRHKLKFFMLQKPPMSKKIKDELCTLYEADIEKLELLIGRDLSEWKK